jgi:hypothetical protein
VREDGGRGRRRGGSWGARSGRRRGPGGEAAEARRVGRRPREAVRERRTAVDVDHGWVGLSRGRSRWWKTGRAEQSVAMRAALGGVLEGVEFAGPLPPDRIGGSAGVSGSLDGPTLVPMCFTSLKSAYIVTFHSKAFLRLGSEEFVMKQ